MVIKIEFTPLSLSDCKMLPFKKGFKGYCNNQTKQTKKRQFFCQKYNHFSAKNIYLSISEPYFTKSERKVRFEQFFEPKNNAINQKVLSFNKGGWSKTQNGDQNQIYPLSDCNILPFLKPKGFKKTRFEIIALIARAAGQTPQYHEIMSIMSLFAYKAV